jgi:cytochrome P450
MTDHDEAPLAYPMRRSCPFETPSGYAQLRQRPTITQVTLPTGRFAWAVTRRNHIRELLADGRMSSNSRHPGYPILAEHMRPPEDFNTSLIGMDDPEHAAARRTVLGEFTVRAINRLRPRIQEIVDQHIDVMIQAGSPADFVRDVAFPVPLMVICELLGVRFEDRALFREWMTTYMSGTASPEEGATALKAYMTYMHELVSAKEAEPDDSLIGRQVRRYGEAGVADHEGQVGLAVMLHMAGHESTANMLALSVVTLLAHPEQLAKIKADPGLIPNAVEELLRFHPIGEIGTSRVAVEDIEIGGVRIAAGEGVINMIAAANSDPEIFPEPENFDIERNAHGHLAFGYGKHQCLGQNLARAELEIVIETLFRRLPQVRLAVPFDEVPFSTDTMMFGVRELPLAW